MDKFELGPEYEIISVVGACDECEIAKDNLLLTSWLLQRRGRVWCRSRRDTPGVSA